MTTSNSINPDMTPQILQTYTLLQIAAEAMFGVRHDKEAALPGSGTIPVGLIDPKVLTDGNNHSSKFTTQQAKDFAANWRVVSHQPNTATGFSATLFEYVGTGPQPTASKYVVSFRSTEFIEDAARDNMATNTMEVQPGGWAFGQIADLERWWNSPGVQAALAGQRVDVTGYSLGGHLATAFYKLHAERINKVYTFNGAGVGDVTRGTLADVINAFDAQRQQGSSANRALFTDAQARAKYEELSGKLYTNATTAALTTERANLALLVDAEQNSTAGRHHEEARHAA